MDVKNKITRDFLSGTSKHDEEIKTRIFIKKRLKRKLLPWSWLLKSHVGRSSRIRGIQKKIL
ncbi:hypothetical protein AAZX31_14G108100 [Glycine max]